MGMIFVFTGNGKGKTTAAIGQAIRVLGNGGRVAFIQFIKSPNWQTGEEKALKEFGRSFKLVKGGKGFVGIMGDRLPRSVHTVAAHKTWELAKKCIKSRKFELVVLDEINVAVSLDLLDTKEICAFLQEYRRKNSVFSRIQNSYVCIGPDIVLTGRSAPKGFIKIADLVTEFKEVKHPFQEGKWGERGREY